MSLKTYNDLHKYQKFAIATGVNLKQVAFILGTGMGKTIIYLAVIDQLLKRGLIDNVLLISTKKAVYNTFRQEAAKWEPTKYLKFSIIHGDAYRCSSARSKKYGFGADTHIKLINYDGIPWLIDYMKQRGFTHKNAKWPFQCIIYDESTKIKHTNTQRFRKLKPYMGYFDYRYIGTGTFAPNGFLDVFGQMYAIDLGESLGTVFNNFKQRYFMLSGSPGAGAKYVPLKGTKESIGKKIKHRMIHMRKEDYQDLPPIIYNPIELDLPEKLYKQYEDLERNFFIELESSKIEAFSSGTLSIKLRQFLQGQIYLPQEDEGKRRTIRVHTEKIDFLKELIDTSKGSTKILEGIGNCIIAFNFKFERDDLLSVFPNAPVIDGATSDKASIQIFEKWNEKKVPILLFNPACDPHGLNLQFGGNQILWYGPTWNYEHYIQLIDRLYRQLQKRNVFVHNLMFRDTLDEVIFKVMTYKGNTERSLLNAIVSYGKEKGLI